MIVEHTFPKVDSFDDYHDIDYERDKLIKYVDTDVKSLELGFNSDEGMYYGYFYVGTKPSKQDIKELKERYNLE